MGNYHVYLLGFRKSDFSKEDQLKLDEHISKWSLDWSEDSYSPIDSRSPEFQNIAGTYADEEPRGDGSQIVIYQDLTIDKEKEKSRFLEVVKDLKAIFSDILLEVHDDDGRVC